MSSLLDSTSVARSIAGIEYKNVAFLLADFRRYIEREADVPIERIELNGALLLNDLCRFFRLQEGERQRVLGHAAAAYVEQVLDGWVGLGGAR
jgi:hypothetical protein